MTILKQETHIEEAAQQLHVSSTQPVDNHVEWFPGAEALLRSNAPTGARVVHVFEKDAVIQALAEVRASLQVIAVEAEVDARDLELNALTVLADVCGQLGLDAQAQQRVFGKDLFDNFIVTEVGV